MNANIKRFKQANGYFLIFLSLLFLIALSRFIDPEISRFVLDEHKTLLVLVYLASLSILVSDLILKMIAQVKKNSLFKRENENFIYQIKNLKDREKFLLSLFIDKDVLELAFLPKEPAIGLLTTKKLLINTYQKDSNGKTIYRIDPMIFEALKINPNLLF